MYPGNDIPCWDYIWTCPHHMVVLEREFLAHVSFLEFGGWRTKVSGRASDSSSSSFSMTCPQNFVPTPHLHRTFNIQHHGISLIAATPYIGTIPLI